MNTDTKLIDDLFITLKYNISLATTTWIRDLPRCVVEKVFDEIYPGNEDYNPLGKIANLRIHVERIDEGSKTITMIKQELIKYQELESFVALKYGITATDPDWIDQLPDPVITEVCIRLLPPSFRGESIRVYHIKHYISGPNKNYSTRFLETIKDVLIEYESRSTTTST